MQWLAENQIPFSIIFTKTDKLSKNNLTSKLKNFKNEMLESWSKLPKTFISSAIKKEGIIEIISYISYLNKEVS